MRNLVFILVVSLLGFVSCNSDDDDLIKEAQGKYELQDIKWRATEGEGVVGQSVEEFAKEKIVNDTDQGQYYTYQPLTDKKWCSTLHFKDAKAYEKLKKAKIDSIYVPAEGVNILPKEYEDSFGGLLVPFQEGCSQMSYDINSKDVYQILPHTQLQVKCEIKVKNVKASFIANYVNSVTKDSIELEGTWEGFYIYEVKISAALKGIKD